MDDPGKNGKFLSIHVIRYESSSWRSLSRGTDPSDGPLSSRTFQYSGPDRQFTPSLGRTICGECRLVAFAYLALQTSFPQNCSRSNAVVGKLHCLQAGIAKLRFSKGLRSGR